jgi:hypothetical protein
VESGQWLGPVSRWGGVVVGRRGGVMGRLMGPVTGPDWGGEGPV